MAIAELVVQVAGTEKRAGQAGAVSQREKVPRHPRGRRARGETDAAAMQKVGEAVRSLIGPMDQNILTSRRRIEVLLAGKAEDMESMNQVETWPMSSSLRRASALDSLRQTT